MSHLTSDLTLAFYICLSFSLSPKSVRFLKKELSREIMNPHKYEAIILRMMSVITKACPRHLFLLHYKPKIYTKCSTITFKVNTAQRVKFLGRGLSSECFFVLLIAAKVLMKKVCLVITPNKTRHTHPV